ncbi:MAG: RluA family pseudouridine synthase [Lachnospiraceae bacterium]|nr:RluA family pseudouridine synthase [Lachnospiraceae bacterium]
MKLDIIYEDKDIIVVDKPASVSVQTKKINEQDVVSYLKNYLCKNSNTENPYLGILHRLDQPVRGILVFALNKKSAASLSKQIMDGSLNKMYYALVEGIVDTGDDQIDLTDYVLKDNNNLAKIVTGNDKNAKKAELKYKTKKICREKNVTLLEIELITGRYHQIRVQMSAMGHPIVGDIKYGASKIPDINKHIIKLCAYSLSIRHPKDNKIRKFTLENADNSLLEMNC